MTKQPLQASFRCQNFDKKQLNGRRCLLTISVGQQSHEGERFQKTLEKVSQTFSECKVVLHDTLQRYTVALDKSEPPEDYHYGTFLLGQNWIARNQCYLDELSIPYEVISWDYWLQQSEFEVYRAEIIKTIESDASYAALFYECVDDFVAKFKMRLNDLIHFDEQRARRLCFDYVVEECTVLRLWGDTGFEFELYPGAHYGAMQETRSRFVHSINPEAVRWVRIAFNRHNRLAPQNLEVSTV
jgi:hypothetical protein